MSGACATSTKSGPARRGSTAAPPGRRARALERGQVLGALAVERDLDDRHRPRAPGARANSATRRSTIPCATRRATRRRQVAAGDTWARSASAWLVSDASSCSSASSRRSVASSATGMDIFIPCSKMAEFHYADPFIPQIIPRLGRHLHASLVIWNSRCLHRCPAPTPSNQGRSQLMCGIVGAVSTRNIVPILVGASSAWNTAATTRAASRCTRRRAAPAAQHGARG